MKGQAGMRAQAAAETAACVCVQVAEILVDALAEPAAANKVVEIIADQNEIFRPASELFANVQ